MAKERKIKMVVNKFSSHEEAEKNDDLFWANATAEERLDQLISLRKMLFDEGKKIKMKKVVHKRHLHEEEAD